jgi:hypothetical protein
MTRQVMTTHDLDPAYLPGIHRAASHGTMLPGGDTALEGRSSVARKKIYLYYGTVKSANGGRHVMAWANSREHALDLIEAALTATEPVQGSVVGPLVKVPADVMKPGVYVEAKPGS